MKEFCIEDRKIYFREAGKELVFNSHEKEREAKANVAAFFALLDKWDKENDEKI